jgi:hypothetical protein
MKAWLTEIRFHFILHPSVFILNYLTGGHGRVWPRLPVFPCEGCG